MFAKSLEIGHFSSIKVASFKISNPDSLRVKLILKINAKKERASPGVIFLVIEKKICFLLRLFDEEFSQS